MNLKNHRHYNKATHAHMVYDDKRSARLFNFLAKEPKQIRDFVKFESELTIAEILKGN